MPEVAKDGFTRNRARIEEKLQRKRILGFLEANGMLEHIRALETERDQLQDAKRVLHERLDAEEADVEQLRSRVADLEAQLAETKEELRLANGGAYTKALREAFDRAENLEARVADLRLLLNHETARGEAFRHPRMPPPETLAIINARERERIRMGG